jgi:hypothetical protein
MKLPLTAPLRRRLALSGLDKTLFLKAIHGGIDAANRGLIAGSPLDVILDRDAIGVRVQGDDRQQNVLLQSADIHMD